MRKTNGVFEDTIHTAIRIEHAFECAKKTEGDTASGRSDFCDRKNDDLEIPCTDLWCGQGQLKNQKRCRLSEMSVDFAKCCGVF